MKVKVVRSSEYYRQFNDLVWDDLKQADYHSKQAKSYKKIYQLTKGRRGIYALLNRFAEKRNEYHVRAGTKLTAENLARLQREIRILTKYISDTNEEN